MTHAMSEQNLQVLLHGLVQPLLFSTVEICMSHKEVASAKWVL